MELLEFVLCEPGQTPSLSSLTRSAVLPAGLGPARSRYGPQPKFKDSYTCWSSATKTVRSPGVPSSGSGFFAFLCISFFCLLAVFQEDTS